MAGEKSDVELSRSEKVKCYALQEWTTTSRNEADQVLPVRRSVHSGNKCVCGRDTRVPDVVVVVVLRQTGRSCLRRLVILSIPERLYLRAARPETSVAVGAMICYAHALIALNKISNHPAAEQPQVPWSSTFT